MDDTHVICMSLHVFVRKSMCIPSHRKNKQICMYGISVIDVHSMVTFVIDLIIFPI